MIVSMNKIVLGNGVIIGPNVVIVDHDHDYKSIDRQNEFKTDSIYIGDNVWIGANVVILKGTHIGANSVVSAGTILKGNYSEKSLIYQQRTIKQKDIDINPYHDE